MALAAVGLLFYLGFLMWAYADQGEGFKAAIANPIPGTIRIATPLVLGALHDGTDGWTWPLVLLLAAVVPMTWAGWGAARPAVLAPFSEASPAGVRSPAASAGPAGPAGR